MEKLHPKAVWLFFIRTYLLFFVGFIGLSIVLTNFFVVIFHEDTSLPFGSIVMWFVIGLIVFTALAFGWAKLSYHFYRYELRSDGFRKELGVINKKYVTIPYNRIQNVDIHRGLIARLFGLSDLNIQTAGASATASRYGAISAGAEGNLPGLAMDKAEELRDELIHRAGKAGTQGL